MRAGPEANRFGEFLMLRLDAHARRMIAGLASRLAKDQAGPG